MTFMRSLPAESMNLIVTSPPYNIGLKYRGSTDKRVDYLEWMHSVFVECHTALTDHGHFFLQVGGISKHPTIPYEVLTQALAAKFILQNNFIWVKNVSLSEKAEDSHGQFKPVPGKRFVNNTFEHIFHLTKTGSEDIDRLAVGVPLKWKSNINRFGHKQDKRCRGSVWFIPYDTIQSKADRHHHPAVFPIALPEMCIRLSGVPLNSLVVDPFMGTGTTLVACERLGMRGVGFDTVWEYCQIAEARLKANA